MVTPRLPLVVIGAALLALPRTLAACSPALRPDQVAERAAFYASIARPFYFAWGVSALAAAIWLVLLVRRPASGLWMNGLAIALVGLVLGQPAWWMESMRGDCGMARDLAGLAVAALSTGLLGVGLWRLRLAARSGRAAPGA